MVPPSTDELLNAAIAARDLGHQSGDGPVSSTSTRLRVGAALLTRGGKIFSACAVPAIKSSADGPVANASVLIPAELACLFNALSHGEHDVHAMFLVSNSCDEYVMPAASSITALAEHGDFPVYIAKADRTMTRYTTAELAAGSDMQLQSVASHNHLGAVASSELDAEGKSIDFADPTLSSCAAIDWTVQDVCGWLACSLALPQYASTFAAASVDGPLLLSLAESDLTDALGVAHPLHRRKICQAIVRLQTAGECVCGLL